VYDDLLEADWVVTVGTSWASRMKAKSMEEMGFEQVRDWPLRDPYNYMLWKRVGPKPGAAHAK
jgi:hypothetical protein